MNNISEERKLYLKKKNRNKFLVFITQIGVLILFVAVWEYAANKGYIDSFIKPTF